MANEEHLEILNQGVDTWNRWREENPDVKPDLREADLMMKSLVKINLSQTDLRLAVLGLGNFYKADFRKANLRKANLGGVNLKEADLREVNLSNTNLLGAKLNQADLRQANLRQATLGLADLREADLRGADLRFASVVRTNVENAALTDCLVYGLSVWNLIGGPREQSNLVITGDNESVITVDNVEVAQFIHLLLYNEKIRHVIDTITSKVVLILGRFTSDRKAILDAIRDELRKHNYCPAEAKVKELQR